MAKIFINYIIKSEEKIYKTTKNIRCGKDQSEGVFNPRYSKR